MSTITPQDPIRTMSADAHHGAQWALLDELATMLEMAQTEVEDLRDAPDTKSKWPDEDARLCIRHINATIEALDALGSR